MRDTIPETYFIIGSSSDSTAAETTAPVDSALTGGTLMLPEESGNSGMAAGHGDVFTDIVTIICIFSIILCLKKIVNAIPSILGCAVRWKEAFNLEDSFRQSNDRNITFLNLIIPFCLISVYFDLYSPAFMDGMAPAYKLLTSIGVLFAYMLLRILMEIIFQPKISDRQNYRVARMLFATFFCLGTMVSLCVAGVMTFAGSSEETIRTVILYCILGFYALFILRKSQIFGHHCSVFSTILYLCTLEIIPTGLLVASATLL